MKTLHIPYRPELDGMNADEISSLLDSDGAHGRIASLNWPGQFPYAPLSAFSIAHSGTAIYIDFFTRCNYLRAENYTNLSPVADDSCVEFFVSPGRNNHYWNFEFNCIGTINASHRSERHHPTRLTDAELASVRRCASCGTRPFKEMEGIFAWNLLCAIPLDLLGVKYTPGQPIEMTANFYKCAGKTSAPHFLTWNPVTSERPDFHRPQDFGTIILE